MLSYLDLDLTTRVRRHKVGIFGSQQIKDNTLSLIILITSQPNPKLCHQISTFFLRLQFSD